MLDNNRSNHGRRRRLRRRDFWRAWREEKDEWQQEVAATGRRGAGNSSSRTDVRDAAQPAPPDWQEHFYEFMGTRPEEHWAFGGRRFTPWHQGEDTFNPFVAGLLSKGGGLLPIYVLHLLEQGPRYANEIMDLIIERTGGGWSANPGAMYPLMTLLENNGLVEGEWGDPRKRTVRVYQLTREGYRELERLKAIVRPKLKEAIAVLNTLVSDLTVHLNDHSADNDVDTVYLQRGY